MRVNEVSSYCAASIRFMEEVGKYQFLDVFPEGGEKVIALHQIVLDSLTFIESYH